MHNERQRDNSYLGKIADEIRPLHNALIMLQIGKYLQSEDFWQLSENNDLKEMYEAASSYVIGEDMLSYETISDAEETLGILLSHLHHDHDSGARLLARLKVILDGFQHWNNREVDYRGLAEPLLLLGFSTIDISRTLGIDERRLSSGFTASNLWSLIHPKIKSVSKTRFESSHYADTVESAFKQLNKVVKEIVKKKTGEERDGASLMEKAFSVDHPIIVLDDLSTESGRNIQKGYLQIFSGVMTGIRNPKTHDNISITKENAINLIFIASHLMFMIDQARNDKE